MSKFDAVVIGAGPGGYVCAIRLAQLGQKVALIDRDNLGGTCLNWGCIPSKALIHAAHLYETMHTTAGDMGFSFEGLELDFGKLNQWKNGIVKQLTGGIGGLCKRHGIEVIMGTAAFAGPNQLEVSLAEGGKKETVDFDKALIATGSASASIPGVEFDGERIIASKEALNLPELPNQMVLVGAGVIGLELGSFYSMLGTQVVVLEYLDQLLPGTDLDLVRVVQKKLESRGAQIHTAFQVQSAQRQGDKVIVRGAPKSGGDELVFETEVVLVSTGRRPYTQALEPERAGINPDERGFINVNQSLQTAAPHIYAIGDVTPGPALAHRASHQALVAAAHLAGDDKAVVDYRVVPGAIFTEPEIASAGLSEAEAAAKGIDIKVGKFPFAALGRALANANSEGFVKLVGDAKTDQLLGMHIVGGDASNLIGEGALAIEMGANIEDLALTVHVHPTYSESIMEAAESYFGHAVHIFQSDRGRK